MAAINEYNHAGNDIPWHRDKRIEEADNIICLGNCLIVGMNYRIGQRNGVVYMKDDMVHRLMSVIAVRGYVTSTVNNGICGLNRFIDDRVSVI